LRISKREAWSFYFKLGKRRLSLVSQGRLRKKKQVPNLKRVIPGRWPIEGKVRPNREFEFAS